MDGDRWIHRFYKIKARKQAKKNPKARMYMQTHRKRESPGKFKTIP